MNPTLHEGSSKSYQNAGKEPFIWKERPSLNLLMHIRTMTSENKHADFDDVTLLMQTGINNYLRDLGY